MNSKRYGFFLFLSIFFFSSLANAGEHPFGVLDSSTKSLGSVGSGGRTRTYTGSSSITSRSRRGSRRSLLAPASLSAAAIGYGKRAYQSQGSRERRKRSQTLTRWDSVPGQRGKGLSASVDERQRRRSTADGGKGSGLALLTMAPEAPLSRRNSSVTVRSSQLKDVDYSSNRSGTARCDSSSSSSSSTGEESSEEQRESRWRKCGKRSGLVSLKLAAWAGSIVGALFLKSYVAKKDVCPPEEWLDQCQEICNGTLIG